MKPFKDYETTQIYTDTEKLPSGYYIGKVLNVEEKTNSNGTSRLELSVDIIEGEFTNYYRENYHNQSLENKKWKGVFRLFIPLDDGSDSDAYKKRAFKTAITAIESSNDGYHWDWNEAKLKGMTVGLAVRQKEWEFNGRSGWSPEIFKFVSVEDVRGGKLKIPENKPLKESISTNSVASGDFTPVDDGDLPF